MSLEFAGSWVARSFPCAAGLRDLQLTISEQRKQLVARSALSSDCAASGALVWQGELSRESVAASDLPLTLRVDMEVPMPRTAAVTLLSRDRMVLLADEFSIKLQRGKLPAAPVDPAPPPLADAGAGGRGGGSGGPQDAGRGGSSGATAAAGGMSGGAGHAGAGQAGRGGAGV
ncbi:MAG TPA: hypothetical protein VJV78_23505, partial [Polyangiales bacterium]|nr:hypothetical protein [Polyangiales bacterium]